MSFSPETPGASSGGFFGELRFCDGLRLLMRLDPIRLLLYELR
jgi:hypothetical protein